MNKVYLCNVKYSIHLILLVFLSIKSTCIHADNMSVTESNDSIEISLLTCYPGDEVYSLYGHTAIRYKDHSKGVDLPFTRYAKLLSSLSITNISFFSLPAVAFTTAPLQNSAMNSSYNVKISTPFSVIKIVFS